MGKYRSKSPNGDVRKSRSSNLGVKYDKYTMKPGSKKGHDHSGMIVDFAKGIAKIFGSGENLGKK